MLYSAFWVSGRDSTGCMNHYSHQCQHHVDFDDNVDGIVSSPEHDTLPTHSRGTAP